MLKEEGEGRRPQRITKATASATRRGGRRDHWHALLWKDF